MVALTKTQAINLAGYVAMRTASIRQLAIDALDSNLTDEQRQRAKNKLKDEVEEVAKLIRTAVVRNNYTLPNDEFTDEQLATKGIN